MISRIYGILFFIGFFASFSTSFSAGLKIMASASAYDVSVYFDNGKERKCNVQPGAKVKVDGGVAGIRKIRWKPHQSTNTYEATLNIRGRASWTSIIISGNTVSLYENGKLSHIIASLPI